MFNKKYGKVKHMSEKKKKSLAKTVCGEHSWAEYGQICLKEKTYKKIKKKLLMVERKK